MGTFIRILPFLAFLAGYAPGCKVTKFDGGIDGRKENNAAEPPREGEAVEGEGPTAGDAVADEVEGPPEEADCTGLEESDRIEGMCVVHGLPGENCLEVCAKKAMRPKEPGINAKQCAQIQRVNNSVLDAPCQPEGDWQIPAAPPGIGCATFVQKRIRPGSNPQNTARLVFCPDAEGSVDLKIGTKTENDLWLGYQRFCDCTK